MPHGRRGSGLSLERAGHWSEQVTVAGRQVAGAGKVTWVSQVNKACYAMRLPVCVAGGRVADAAAVGARVCAAAAAAGRRRACGSQCALAAVQIRPREWCALRVGARCGVVRAA
eukprot:351125-Chlamydomonas_euryale.AAC.1